MIEDIFRQIVSYWFALRAFHGFLTKESRKKVVVARPGQSDGCSGCGRLLGPGLAYCPSGFWWRSTTQPHRCTRRCHRPRKISPEHRTSKGRILVQRKSLSSDLNAFFFTFIFQLSRAPLSVLGLDLTVATEKQRHRKFQCAHWQIACNCPWH